MIGLVQQHLVFRGTVLRDDLTLAYYNIDCSSKVYLVIIQPRKMERPRPFVMATKLMRLTEELPEADSERYSEIIFEITQIIQDPIFLANARINPEVQTIISEAIEAMETTERPISRKTAEFIARNQDIFFDQFESSPDGLRVFQSILEDSEDEPDQTPQTTHINYTPKIQTKALPNPWRNKETIFQDCKSLRVSLPSSPPDLRSPRRVPNKRPNNRSPILETDLRTKFESQLTTLKLMGFKDENVILKALSETNGNVQKAARILQNQSM